MFESHKNGYYPAMSWILSFADYFLHLDVHLGSLIAQYGSATYGVLFLIIFCETGLVVTPFLPGDSLLFATGAFAALGSLNVLTAFVLLVLAAILGDSVNYAVGRRLGPAAVEKAHGRWLKREHLERTQRFFETHGAKTIILARFVPIVRTIAPFVAGVGQMHYRRFVAYNVAGGILWVGIFLFAGFLFGNVPVVKKNFTLVVFAIIGISLLPGVWEWWRGRGKRGT